MTTFLLMLIPPGALVLYALWRYANRRPLRRHDLNLVYAILLLGYFLTTSGLGIFWVANQELPVFDLHYLFGYITLALVLVHLGFNHKAVIAFLRRRAPSVALTSDGRSWRPAIRTTAWVLGLALLGGICYLLGVRQGSSRVTVVQGPPPALAPSRIVPRQMVTTDGKEVPLAVYYHDETKHSRTRIVGEASRRDLSRRPSVFKAYADAPRIPLPRDFIEDETSTGEAIDARRSPVHSLDPEGVSIRHLSTLLHMANGITARQRYPGGVHHFRSAPSAGALYPTVTYVLVNQVDGIEPGLYHYGVKDHGLRRIPAGGDLAAVSSRPHLVRGASAVFIFSSIYFRSSWKYRARAYRYCLLDAGHVGENLMLAASALDLASVPIGRFDDGGVNLFLGIDDSREAAVLLVPVGLPSEDDPPSGEMAFVADPREPAGDEYPVILLAHGRTCLGITEDVVNPLPPRQWEDRPFPDRQVIGLSGDFPRGAALLPTIEERRSHRKWLPQGMTLEELSSILYHAFGIRDGALSDPSVESSHLLRLYLIVNEVQGIEPGVYAYRRRDHSLVRIEKGDFRSDSYEISLHQEVVGDSGVALILTIDVASLGYPDGDRGYRYACLDAGMLGGRLYLQAGALGLGCCGIGAFFDDEVSEVIGVDPSDEMVIYMAAIGVKGGG